MSSNHHYMSSEEFLAKVRELEQLKRGDKRAIEKALAEARKSLKKMKKEGSRIDRQMSAERRRHIEKLERIEQRAVTTLTEAGQIAATTQQDLVQLRGEIQDAIRDTEALVKDISKAVSDAAELKRKASIELAVVKTDVDYQRFAQDRLDAIQASLDLDSRVAMAPEARMAALRQVMSDIFVMDAYVSGQRLAFLELQGKALEDAHTILAEIGNVRSSTTLIGQERHRISDIDFWTDGCMGEVEAETKAILDRLESAPSAPGYTLDMLRKDCARLQELNGIRDSLLATALAKLRLSQYRVQEAGLISEILHDDHHFNVVAEGFDLGGDEREAYVIRMRRSDGARIEVIINPGQKNGEVDTYFRVDAETYRDAQVMAGIQKSILDELETNGIVMVRSESCTPEPLPEFKPTEPVQVTETARRRHGIRQREQIKI